VNSRHIIAQAWHFTKENKPLMWWYGFLPALLTTLIGIFYLVYQFFSFKRSALFDNAKQSFITEVFHYISDFFSGHEGLLWPSIITVIIVLIAYALLPTLMQGGLIQVIVRKRKGQPVRNSDGIALGMLVFLPLLEYHLLINGFSLVSLFTEAGFLARNLGASAMKTLLPVFILAAFIGLVLTLLFTYSEFFIVLEKKPVMKSMLRSAKLVIISWQHTFLIAILMLIISLRVIINIIAVLLVPALLFFSAGLIATFTFSGIGIAIGIIIAVVTLTIASYFSGILHLFANTVWTYTFMDLMDEPTTKELMGE
jgi:hypothetical protein